MVVAVPAAWARGPPTVDGRRRGRPVAGSDTSERWLGVGGGGWLTRLDGRDGVPLLDYWRGGPSCSPADRHAVPWSEPLPQR